MLVAVQATTALTNAVGLVQAAFAGLTVHLAATLDSASVHHMPVSS